MSSPSGDCTTSNLAQILDLFDFTTEWICILEVGFSIFYYILVALVVKGALQFVHLVVGFVLVHLVLGIFVIAIAIVNSSWRTRYWFWGCTLYFRLRILVQDQGASSSRVCSTQPVWDRDRFTSWKNARWYEEKKSNAIVIEKIVFDEIDSTIDIRHAFDIIGWAPMLGFEGNYYPCLTHEFYVNIEDKGDAVVTRVMTSVKGCRIKLDRAKLARILGVSNEGPSVEFSKDAVLSDRQYKLIDALARLHYSPMRNDRTRDMVFHTPSLLIPQCLLVYLYSSNVLPRASSLNEVFEFFKVDLTGEDIVVTGPTDVLTEVNLYRMEHVASSLKFFNCIGLVTRQGVMEAQLQCQDEQL
ncbi:hypothetical protein FNV43_RR16924 [Rhamnella rubrinervis]|uniref:Uncharacterized protein n=1 Tax=Rhamnella rubrinervis TaxID=2594499 RepID=A0A8K0GZQ5_9ROSA|nr:hypothetical protein FNV43_RR16924 [Rhamnella rubrinervis]